MQCSECANDNAPASKFCTRCGASLQTACAVCGRNYLPAARFCGWCGASRSAPALVMEPRGERKQATVLFADVVGSTELIAGLDVESAIARLQPVVAAMARSVKRFDGTVLRTLGDGLKAAFGAPHAQEGHALLACQAALAMQDAMTSLPNPTTIRIGLHSGEVVTGALDTGSSVQQEAQGMTVHIASRVEQAADPGTIYLSTECRALVAAYCDTASAGARMLRGISGPVEVFRLIGLKPAIASDRFRDADLVRLRGRETELGILKQALLDAEQGVASVIGIAAPAGMGKSRLCYEFGEWCRQRQIDVLEARAHIFGRATPLLPVLEMMRAFFRIVPGLEPAVARQKIQERLLAVDPSFAADVPLLADFLGLAAPELAGQNINPKTRHVRLLDHLRRMVKSAGRQTSVIIFEDLHWLDEPSFDFVKTMVEAVEGTNIVMVMNYRPTFASPWSALGYFRELSLAELDRNDIGQLIRELVGGDKLLEKMIAHVAEQSGGNPFFAEEIVRALAQSGVLTGERGAYQLASSGWHDPVLPATVEAVISARIDLLPEHDKTVLQIGAVIGKEYPLALVREVAGLAEQEAEELLGRLCDMELILGCMTALGPGFVFRHPLIQEVAYAMQLRSRRTRLHAAVAKAIEGFPWGRLDEFASLLAHHCEAAGQPVEAAMHLRRAALWVGRTNPSQTMADWKKIRTLLQDQPRRTDIDELRALANGRVLGLAWSLGLSAEDVKPYAEEALHFAREAGDHRHEALLTGAYGRVFAASGSLDEYVARARQGVALAKASADPGVFIASSGHLSQACFYAGLLRHGLAVNDTAMAAIDAQSRPQDGVVLGLNASQIFGFNVPQWLRCYRVRTLALLGRFAAAEADLALALAVDARDITPVVQYIAHLGAVDMAWHRGDAAVASWHASEVLNYADQSGLPYLLVAALGCQGLAASAEGYFDLAAHHFQEARATARQSRTGLENEAKLIAFLADTYDRAGDFTQAARIAAEAIEAGRRRGDRIAELHASIVAAHALYSTGEARRQFEAEGHLGRAEDLLETSGAAIFQPMFQRAVAQRRVTISNECQSLG